MLAGIGAMGLLGTPGCAALTEESKREGRVRVRRRLPKRSRSMPASHFRGRLLPGCCALRSTRRTLLQLSTRGREK